MRTQRGLAYGLFLTSLCGLTFFGWTQHTPAHAQADPAKPADPPAGIRPVMMGGPATVAASGDFVYVLRGGTLYQMKSSDLSLVKQQDLPAPGAAGAAVGDAPKQ